FDVDQAPNQSNCSPWNIEGWEPYGAIGINPLATAHNSPVDSGNWSCSTVGTTTSITVTGISRQPSYKSGAYGSTYRTVAVGTLGFFIPDSDIPLGNSTGTNEINNIVMTGISGATATDTNSPNNTSTVSTLKLNPGTGTSATA